MKAQDLNLKTELAFHPEQGKLLLLGSRMLLFRQEAMGVLRSLLVEHLGPQLSRAMLAQFGYRSGAGDFAAMSRSHQWDSDAEMLASGPVMHMWEGIVHVTPTAIEFDHATGHFYMAGEWRNSYEADLIMSLGGRSTEPVCHSLTGYASGWSTSFFGRPLLCIETTCVACGDDCCRFVCRPPDAWGPEADPWRRALAETDQSISKALELRVAERTSELLRTNEELVRAKLAAEAATIARGQFLATMSHEVRTPISAILGLADLVLDGELGESERLQIRTIRDSGESLLSIVNDILDFSKIEAGRLDLESTAFSPSDSVASVLGLLRARAKEKGLALRGVIDAGLPPRVRGDSLRFRQILINLVGNAIKFTAAGEVEVRVGFATDDEQGAGATRGRLTFAVRDTGMGIPPDRIAQLFQPFRQLDASTARRFGGTGLGLVISRHLATLMGGDLGVQSEEGRGSVFSGTIAVGIAGAQDLEPVTRAALSPDAAATPRGPLRILLAEDNHVLRTLGVEMLRRLGYPCDVAVDGVATLERLRASTYDLLLLDVQMPVMDGLETVRHIRAEWAEAERPLVVALTANAMVGDRATCLEAGMDDYLSKPVKMTELVRVLDEAARWRATHRPPAPLSPDAGPDAQPAQDELRTDEATHTTAPWQNDKPHDKTHDNLLVTANDDLNDNTDDEEAVGEDGAALDRAVIDQMCADLSPEDTREVLLAFVSDAVTLLQQLEAAFVAGTPAELKRSAHTLKSTARTVGALTLGTMCAAVEQQAPQHRAAIDRIAAELVRVRKSAEREIERLAAL